MENRALLGGAVTVEKNVTTVGLITGIYLQSKRRKLEKHLAPRGRQKEKLQGVGKN